MKLFEQSEIEQHRLGTVTSSADILAEYLLNDMREGDHFGTCIGDFQPGMPPHIFAYVLDHRVSRGEATKLERDSWEELLRLKWQPAHPFVVHQDEDPDYVLVAPPTPSNTYHSDQYPPQAYGTPDSTLDGAELAD